MTARRRMIHDRFWRSEKMARLPLNARFLFVGLITNADDQGRLRGHPGLIRSDVFPLDDIPLQDFEEWLSGLAEVGSIIRYEVDDVQLIQIVNWWEYQQPAWAWPSEHPAPQEWQDRLKYRRGNTVVVRNWPGSEDTPAHSDPAVTPQWDHDEPTVRPAPSTSTSTSDSDRDSTSCKQAATPSSNGYTHALRAYERHFGVLGPTQAELFCQLWDTFDVPEMHEYALGEMQRARDRPEKPVRPNLRYYEKCLITFARENYAYTGDKTLAEQDGITAERGFAVGGIPPPG